MLIAQATQPSLPGSDFATAVTLVVGAITALLIAGAGLLTAIAALLGVVHVNGKVGTAAAKGEAEAKGGAALLTHIGQQVNNHGGQIVTLANTKAGRAVGASLESGTLAPIETLTGTLMQTAPATQQATFTWTPSGAAVAIGTSTLPGLVALILLCLIPFGLGGCAALQSVGASLTGTSAAAPSVQVAQLETSYAGVTNAIVQLRAAGTIKAGSSIDTGLKQADNAAYAALVSLRQAVAAGQPLSADTLSAFNAALTSLQAGQSTALHGTVNPTSP